MASLLKKLLDQGIYNATKNMGYENMTDVRFLIAEKLHLSKSTVDRLGEHEVSPEDLDYVIRLCVKEGRMDQKWVRDVLRAANYQGSNKYRDRAEFLNTLFPKEPATRSRVFICYQRGIEPDATVAMQVREVLNEEHDVFSVYARSMDVSWAERVQSQLRQSDFLIIFLSSASAAESELIQELVEMAGLLNQEQEVPTLVPVRLAYHSPLQGVLDVYLGSLGYALWQSKDDTPRLIEELKAVITGDALPSPPLDPSAEKPEQFVDRTGCYIERSSDRIALQEIQRQGVTIVVKAPRQMGKTLLLYLTGEQAKNVGKQVVFLDFQLLRSSLENVDIFFREFCASLTTEMEIDDLTGEYWSTGLSDEFACTRYFEKHILGTTNRPLTLIMDEVDRVFEHPFSEKFFGMLLAWHKKRGPINSTWRNLDLVLATSTEPYLYIDKLTQSPFNVGEIVELQDFSKEQIAELNRCYGLSLSPNDMEKLWELLGGHPFLTHRAINWIANRRLTAGELFTRANNERGPFGDHLRALLLRLYGKEELIQALCNVIRENRCDDLETERRLWGAGLIRKDNNGNILPRCRLYADFFRKYCHG